MNNDLTSILIDPLGAEPLPDSDQPAASASDEPTLRTVCDAVAAIQQDLRGHDERTAAAQRIIEKLHEENDRLRVGERQMVLRPVQADLQRMRNDLLRQAETLPPDLSSAQAADMLVSFAVTVELVLERCGVRVVRPEQGTAFDAATQRAVGTSPAPSSDLDATVAECLTDGYLDTVTQRTMTPASVRVYRWDGQQPAQKETHVQ
jgi:molecular chaperone GrpE